MLMSWSSLLVRWTDMMNRIIISLFQQASDNLSFPGGGTVLLFDFQLFIYKRNLIFHVRYLYCNQGVYIVA